MVQEYQNQRNLTINISKPCQKRTKVLIMKSRRQFIKLAGVGIAATGMVQTYCVPAIAFSAEKPKNTFSVGMAGYTFREFSVDQTIELMNKVGVKEISVKDFHVPLNSTQEQISAVINKFRNAGISVYAVGVIDMEKKESVEQAFEYARMAGVRMIVGAPNYDLLPFVEEKVKSYDFKLAIHNHGPEDPYFPNATVIWNHVKNLDPRMGICLDIGHNMRDGADSATDIMRYSKRIYDVHIKDVDKAVKEAKSVEIGRGIIDIPGIVAALRKTGYNGCCSLEYEKDMNDPLAGIAESIGYWKGVMAC